MRKGWKSYTADGPKPSQAMADPSSRIAAKVRYLNQMHPRWPESVQTPELQLPNCVELSPLWAISLQVKTDPPARSVFFQLMPSRSSKRLVVGQLFSCCKNRWNAKSRMFRMLKQTNSETRTETKHDKKEDIQKTEWNREDSECWLAACFVLCLRGFSKSWVGQVPCALQSTDMR